MNRREILKRFLTFVLCATVALTFMPSMSLTLADETAGKVLASEEQTDKQSSSKEEAAKEAKAIEVKEKEVETETKETEPKEAEKKETPEEPSTEEKTASAEENESKASSADSDGSETKTNEAEATEVAPETSIVDAETAPAEDKSGSVEATESNIPAEADEVMKKELNAEAPKAATTIRVNFHFKYMGTDGSYIVGKDTWKNVSVGGKTTNIALSTANSYVPSAGRNVKVGDDTFVFANSWKDSDGKDVSFPLSMTYEEAAKIAGEASSIDVDLYAKYGKEVTIRVHYVDIYNSNGTISTVESQKTVSPNSSSSLSKKQMESATGVVVGNSQKAKFSYAGYKYEYKGVWEDADGNKIDGSKSFQLKYGDLPDTDKILYFNEDTDLYFHPVYEKTMVQGLDYHYIDNISTGSGSWSNSNAHKYRSEFGSLTHTFKNPEDASPTLTPHYSFRYWQTDEYIQNGAHVSSKEGKRYNAGDSFTYSVDSGLPEGTVTEVNIYAYWQPSVTVRYHYNGNVVETEQFKDISVYSGASDEFADEGISYSADGNTLTIGGEEYSGWYNEDGSLLSEDAAYKVPGITKSPVERTIYDVYAKKQIVVKAADNTWVYDGTEHSDNDASVTAGKLIDGDAIETVNTGRITDKGSVDNEIDEITITRDGEDVTSYYSVSFEKGTLSVTPAPLKIKTQSATKAYDGKALTKADGSVSGLQNNETATVTGTGSQTKVGSSKNTYSMSWESAKADNYEIVSEDLGTLTVTAVDKGDDDGAENPDADEDPDDETDDDDPAPVPVAGGRTDRGGGNPGGGTNTGNGAPAAGTTTPSIPDSPVPQSVPEANIPDPATPLAEGAWALINLIAAILTALGAIIALFRRKEEEDEEDEQETMAQAEAKGTMAQAEAQEEDEEDNRGKKMLVAKVAGALAGIAAPIVFILTEDMSLPMVLTDKWTILMLIILAVQVVAAIFNKRASKLDDDDEDADDTKGNYVGEGAY